MTPEPGDMMNLSYRPPEEKPAAPPQGPLMRIIGPITEEDRDALVLAGVHEGDHVPEGDSRVQVAEQLKGLEDRVTLSHDGDPRSVATRRCGAASRGA